MDVFRVFKIVEMTPHSTKRLKLSPVTSKLEGIRTEPLVLNFLHGSFGNSCRKLMWGSQVQSHWMVLRSTQPFILLRSIKYIWKNPGDLVVTSKLSPSSDSVALRKFNIIHERVHKVFIIVSWKELFYFNFYVCTKYFVWLQ